jgi:hypothetical protein
MAMKHRRGCDSSVSSTRDILSANALSLNTDSLDQLSLNPDIEHRNPPHTVGSAKEV